MTDDELLTALDPPELPPALDRRVHALARSELATTGASVALPLRLALSGALVPSLLVTAATVHAAETVHVAKKIFPGEHG